MRYLYHGSPTPDIECFIPQLARGVGSEKDQQIAVYATHSRQFAIPFALPLQPDLSGQLGWSMIVNEDTLQPQIDLQAGSLDLSANGYLYTLPAKTFEQIDEYQWVSFEAVKPVQIDVIEPMKYRFWIKGTEPDYTIKQGQYLAFIYNYTKISGHSPSQVDMERYFKTSPSAVHQMVLRLEKLGFLSREPDQSRALRLLIEPHQLPYLQ